MAYRPQLIRPPRSPRAVIEARMQREALVLALRQRLAAIVGLNDRLMDPGFGQVPPSWRENIEPLPPRRGLDPGFVGPPRPPMARPDFSRPPLGREMPFLGGGLDPMRTQMPFRPGFEGPSRPVFMPEANTLARRPYRPGGLYPAGAGASVQPLGRRFGGFAQ